MKNALCILWVSYNLTSTEIIAPEPLYVYSMPLSIAHIHRRPRFHELFVRL